MSDVIEIRNCEIRYACPNKWDEMEYTKNDAVRFCSACERHVHLCRTKNDLHHAMIENYCVAIKIDSTAKKYEEGMLVGDIVPI